MSTVRAVIPHTIADVFDDVLVEDPEREALVTRTGRWTYHELDALADRAAHALVALGIGPGDRIAVALPNDLDVITTFHGAMRVGAIWVGMNRALTPPERHYVIDDSGAALFVDDDHLDVWRDAMAHASGGPFVPSVPLDPHAPAAIAYTSGTTGYPKGALHSQYNLLVAGAVIAAERGWGSDTRKGDCLPLTILNMQVLTTLLTGQVGACAVIMDRVDVQGVVEWIRAERPSVVTLPPAVVYSLAHDDAFVLADLASLREVTTGGADCPEAVRNAFERKFGLEVLLSYGLTEAPTIVTVDRPGEHVAGASGRPLPHLEVEIVDDEICVRATQDGPWAGMYRPMLGYWNRPDETAATVVDGVLHTGDVGFLDESGFLHVRDRKNLVINRGGANVYPAEVERVLHELAAVAACAVVGVPDERLGERVVAAVELAPGTSITVADLDTHCRANLAKYKVPERFVFVDHFERNSMNKIQRRDLPKLFM